jgi:hypothetical protein
VLEGALGGVIGFLALLGAVALVIRTLRGALRFGLRAAEIASASGMAEASARRGDLTALSEARGAIETARISRRRNAYISLAWSAWLIVPLLFGGVPEAWALAAPLWLLPGSSPKSSGR